MHKKSHGSLELHPRPSVILRFFTLTSHLLVFALLLYLMLQLSLLALLLPIVVLSLAWELRKQSTSNLQNITRLLRTGADEWRWHYADGSVAKGSHLASSLRLPRLVILHLRRSDNGAVERLVLPLDSLSDDEHRRLRIALTLPAN